jgi:pyruvate,orthophosphate dikinase
MTELLLLQAVRLKGRISVEAASVCASIGVDEARTGLDALIGAGNAKAAGTSVRITPEGRERLAELLVQERAGVDEAALEAAYHEFDDHNSALKSVVTAWQLKDADTPNDHTDAAYDQGVIGRLVALHGNFSPLLERIIGQASRLAPYAGRFDNAVRQLRAGDHSFVARPIADSYHTVWFELHEELIGLLGRTRADEAAAGRAL